MYGFIVSYYEKSNFVKKLIKYKKLLVPILGQNKPKIFQKVFTNGFLEKQHPQCGIIIYLRNFIKKN